MVLKRLRLRFQDMRTISKLISGADEQALLTGEHEPGAEHFLLSALELPDGTARRVFGRMGADPEQFRLAIKEQYSEALSSIGIDGGKVMEEEPEPVTSNRVLHNSKPSGQAVMKKLYALKKQDRDRPLLGVHIVDVVAHMEHGVAPRALRAMGIEKEASIRCLLFFLDFQTTKAKPVNSWKP